MIRDALALFDGARGHGSCLDFLCDLVRLFGIKIHRNLDAVSFDEYPHHPQIGRADLHVGLDVALVVDTHVGPFELLVIFLQRGGLDWQGRGGQRYGMEFTLRPFAADDADWLVHEHATHYAQVEGFDDSFGPLVAQIVQSFLAQHDPDREAGWIAHQGQTRLGSIFCVRKDAQIAKLRLFYVVEKARGCGVAQALLDQCLGFAQGAGYKGLTLWTHESHVAAGRIYKRNGLTRTRAAPVHSFGVDLVEETWEIAF